MSTDHTCPQCHAKLPPDAPAGLCPRCLIRSAAGLGDPLPDVDFPDIGNAADVARRLPQFEIVELLGQGGMGVVYKARQPALDRLVALKILPPAEAQSPDFVERFRREARALAKLSHPNIVMVHECGEAGGLYYFVMEYVDGANLRALLQDRRLTPAEALAIVPRVCDALEYAHSEGVIHRDIKPENLLIDKKGRVKIADFGLAKLLRRESLDVTLTLSGAQLGTLRYMAPEQMEKPETVDHRADIYSLGVVIYEMLTGEVPMGRFALPSERAQVDVRLDEIVLRSLERDVERRYQHASEVKTAVEDVATQPPTSNPRGRAVHPLLKEWQRYARPALRLVTLLAALTGVAFVAAKWQDISVVVGEFKSPGYDSGLGLAAGLLLLLAFVVTLITFNTQRITAPAIVLAASLCSAGFLGLYYNDRPLPEGRDSRELVERLRRSYPELRTTGRTDGDIIREFERNNLVPLRQDLQLGFYVSLDCALIVALAAMLDCIFFSRRIVAGPATGTAEATTRTSPELYTQIILWTVFILGSIVFLTWQFMVEVSDPITERTRTTIGAIQPWFVRSDRGISLNLLTWSAFAGVLAILAGAKLYTIQSPRSGPPRPPGAWTPMEIAAATATSAAFLLGGINAIFDMVQNSSPVEPLTRWAIILAAVSAIALLIAQQFRPAATPSRAALPELFFPALAACAGGLTWTWVFSDITGWNFWHGAVYAGLNFMLALFLLITGGATLAKTRALAIFLTGLVGLALVLWWNAGVVTFIGGTSGMMVNRKPVFSGAYLAAALAVLTAITGALRLRVAVAQK